MESTELNVVTKSEIERKKECESRTERERKKDVDKWRYWDVEKRKEE